MPWWKAGLIIILGLMLGYGLLWLFNTPRPSPQPEWTLQGFFVIHIVDHEQNPGTMTYWVAMSQYATAHACLEALQRWEEIAEALQRWEGITPTREVSGADIFLHPSELFGVKCISGNYQ